MDRARSDLKEFRLKTQVYKIAGRKKRVRCALVLLRHGQSVYNQEKIFTGWADPDLTNRGREEARLAGQLLKATGIKSISRVYTSLLKRAVKTAVCTPLALPRAPPCTTLAPHLHPTCSRLRVAVARAR